MTQPQRIVSGTVQEEDHLDTSLRPRRLQDYVGQELLKSNLEISVKAARQRGEPLDHTLLYGPPGLGETTLAGAVRETREEACATVDPLGLYTVFNLPHISQVYLFYRARLTDDGFSPGEETTDVALFDEQDIPWDALAFPVITNTLRHYFSDRQSGDFPVRVEDIVIQRR